jgi:uncharacterized protein
VSDQNYYADSEPVLIYQTSDNALTCAGQCDCACTQTPSLTLENDRIDVEVPYILHPFFTVSPLTDNYYVVHTYDSYIAVCNKSVLCVTEHFKQAHYLTDIPLAWRDTWGENATHQLLREMCTLGFLLIDQYDVAAVHECHEVLSAWFHVTDRCNLRCAYCYLPHLPKDMTFDVGCASVDAVFRSALKHSYTKVKLKYAGGEAMLRFDFVCNLHRYAQQKSHQHEIALEGVLLSNGTLLTPSIITKIKELKLRLMISLDGIDTSHNQQRFYSGGHGSFSDVARGVELALSYGVVPDIAVTVTGRNAANLPELMEWILDRNLPFSLNFYRTNDYSLSSRALKLEEGIIIQGLKAAYHVIESHLPERRLLASLVDRANLSTAHLKPCAVGKSYLVFNSTGQVSTCQMQMNQAVSDIQVEDPLASIQADSQSIQNISVDDKEVCHSCEWRYWCAGGCPLETFRATGRYDTKSPNCTIYKELYPIVIRLEGLRLLQYASKI